MTRERRMRSPEKAARMAGLGIDAGPGGQRRSPKQRVQRDRPVRAAAPQQRSRVDRFADDDLGASFDEAFAALEQRYTRGSARSTADRRPGAPALSHQSSATTPRTSRSTGSARSNGPEPGSTRRSQRLNDGRAAARNRREVIPGRRRVVAMGAVFLTCFTGLSLRLADVQLASASEWSARGEQQRMDIRSIPANRGDLLDRFGLPLALSIPVFDVVVDQKGIASAPYYQNAKRRGDAVKKLSAIVNKTTAEVDQAMRGTSRRAFLVRDVDDRVAQRLRSEPIPGIYIEERSVRSYPAGNVASGIVGRVAPDQRGKTGLEFILDDDLTGTDGEQRIEFGRGGRSIPQGEYTVRPARNGESVIATIDRSMQFRTEEVLADWVNVTGAKGGTVVILDVKTGDVLVMASVAREASRTSADTPTQPGDGDVVVTRYPAGIIDTFEPGSMMKAITLSGAMDYGVRGPNDPLVVSDRIQVSDHLFTDDTPHPHMKWTLTDIMSNSSNVGTIMVAREMGRNVIDENLRKFGFGETANLGFPNEAAGIWLKPRRWTGTSIGTIPIGQGITVTALQMAAAYNTIANDGLYLEPRLERGRMSADGQPTYARIVDGRRVLKAETAQSMRSMLAQVVRTGSGRNAAVLGYEVAGKTGTARKAIKGQYVKGAYVSSFAGMFPASSPRVTMLVTVDEPQTDFYAGTIAAPLFGEITRIAAQRYRIAPAGGQEIALNTRAPEWSAALADAQAIRREKTLGGATSSASERSASRVGTRTRSTVAPAADEAADRTVERTADRTADRTDDQTADQRVEAGTRSRASDGAAVDTADEPQEITPRRRVASWPATTAVAARSDAQQEQSSGTSSPPRRTQRPERPQSEASPRQEPAEETSAPPQESGPVQATRTATVVETGET
jgi:cell division protein FtsI (penicillin-binding protein 3)